jgi:hypothetical protein
MRAKALICDSTEYLSLSSDLASSRLLKGFCTPKAATVERRINNLRLLLSVEKDFPSSLLGGAILICSQPDPEKLRG